MIKTEQLSVGYDEKIIVKDININIKKGSIVSIIGPNGSGKSTLLKTIARLQGFNKGKVIIDDTDLTSIHTKELAKKMSILSQSNGIPGDMTVSRLVSYGRTPHKKWFETMTSDDHDIINWALDKTGVKKYHDTPISCLSGGERQRAWIAMALAQKTDLLLLDEPTTYLDISHQYEVMNLVEDLNKQLGVTIVMVLHDLNQAIRYSHEIIAVKNGSIALTGQPDEVLTKESIQYIYDMDVEILKKANGGHSLVIPYASKENLKGVS